MWESQIIKVKRERGKIYYKGEIINDCIFIEETKKDIRSQRYAIFECRCGNKFETQISKIKNKHTKSCGCLTKLVNHGKTHGLSETVEYKTWLNIKGRCYNLNEKHYKDYGGRGIKVCDRWLESFEAFLEDVGKRPEGKYSLDRKNNNGDYCKENCRWATDLEQANNKRNNVVIEHDGLKMTITQWANKLEVDRTILSRRYNLGWSDRDIVTVQIRQRKRL